jgi:hypothetical protein
MLYSAPEIEIVGAPMRPMDERAADDRSSSAVAGNWTPIERHRKR